MALYVTVPTTPATMPMLPGQSHFAVNFSKVGDVERLLLNVGRAPAAKIAGAPFRTWSASTCAPEIDERVIPWHWEGDLIRVPPTRLPSARWSSDHAVRGFGKDGQRDRLATHTRPRKSLNWKCPAELFMPESFDFFEHHHQLVALRT